MPCLRGCEELAEYICQNYSGRVVEVGAGYVSDVALCLKDKSHLHLAATDREARNLKGLEVQADDIFFPGMDLYQGASLLYSLRPPLEVQLAMGDVARWVGADVIIRPLEDEVADLPGFERSLVNLGQARFYLFRLSA